MQQGDFDSVALVFVGTSPAAKRTASALKKELGGWVAPDRWDPILEGLVASAKIARDARGKLSLTPAGVAEAGRFLGLGELPSRLRWAGARAMLLGRATQTTSGNGVRLARGDALVGAIVAADHGIEVAPGTPAGRVKDLIVAKQLGIDMTKPLTLEMIRRSVLASLAGEAGAPDSTSLMRQLAARSVGARSTGPAELQRAVFHRWLSPTTAATLGEFARQVTAATAVTSSGRFGDNKVFIAHVWRALNGGAGELGDFKRRLLEANRERLLTLVRADLVSVMDPGDVAESEIIDGHAAYHFIVSRTT